MNTHPEAEKEAKSLVIKKQRISMLLQGERPPYDEFDVKLDEENEDLRQQIAMYFYRPGPSHKNFIFTTPKKAHRVSFARVFVLVCKGDCHHRCYAVCRGTNFARVSSLSLFFPTF